MQRRHRECISSTAASPNAKADNKTLSSNTSFRCKPPFLPGPLHFHFLLRSASLLMINKRPAAPEQSRALPCPKPPKVSTNRQLWKNIKIKQGLLPQSPEHYIPIQAICDLEIFWIKEVSVYVKRPSINLPNHFGAYVNFSNNILWERFHSLDMLHDETTSFVLSLLLSSNLYDFLYHKTSLDQLFVRKMIWVFSVLIWYK